MKIDHSLIIKCQVCYHQRNAVGDKIMRHVKLLKLAWFKFRVYSTVTFPTPIRFYSVTIIQPWIRVYSRHRRLTDHLESQQQLSRCIATHLTCRGGPLDRQSGAEMRGRGSGLDLGGLDQEEVGNPSLALWARHCLRLKYRSQCRCF